jgi:hypothetical protein
VGEILCLLVYICLGAKNPIKTPWLKPSPERQKRRPKDAQPAKIKKRESYLPLIHSPSNAAYIQIMRSNNNGRSRTSISHQQNLPL